MDIGLIYPPSTFLDDPHSQPPLGLMYVAASLKNAGYNPVFHDWSNEVNWRVRLSEIKEKIVGCYCVYPHFNWIKKLHEELKNLGVKLIVGGPDPSGHPGDYLDRADMVIQGEGERAVIDAIQFLQENYPHMVIHKPLMNIDCVPWPLRKFDGFDVRNFHQEFHDGLLTTVMFSRGCYGACKFCNSKSIWERQVRRRNPNNCAVEIRHIRNEYGFDRFFPEDDSFCSLSSWVIEFCDLIKNDAFKWRCLTRARDLNMVVLDSMYKAGCRRVSIGVESGSAKILRNISKGETVSQQMRGIKLAKQVGMEVQAFFILGLPGEDKSTIEETRKFLEEARPDFFNLTLLRVFPDSDIYLERDKLDIEILDFDPEASWYSGGLPKSGVRTKALSAEDLESAYRELYDYTFSLGSKHTAGHYMEMNKYPQIKSGLQ
jgi:anaerobic magnesium-protoporphyrin IX monomethyl ester cyclase